MCKIKLLNTGKTLRPFFIIIIVVCSIGPLRVTMATPDTSASAAGEERTSITLLSVSRQLYQK